MAGTQVALYLIHPRLDAMLDAQTHSVINPSSFHSLHETYLTIVSVQWFAGLVQFIAVIADLRGKNVVESLPSRSPFEEKSAATSGP